MGSYLQWARGRRVTRRVTWVFGPEAVLAREVEAAFSAGALPEQRAALFAGEAAERGIWDALLTVPPEGGRRAVVYGAERLRDLSALEVLAAEPALETGYALFISADGKFEGKPASALQASRNGQVIRCCEPSSADDRISLAASWWPGLPMVLAQELLAGCGSLERAWLACEQARLAELKPERAMVAAVSPGGPGGDLADHLMAGDRRRAMEAASRLARGEAGAVIGLLAARLATVEQVAEGVRQGLTPGEAAARLQSDRYTARRALPWLGFYGQDRIRRCRALLASLDAAWRSGAAAGVTESLVALW